MCRFVTLPRPVIRDFRIGELFGDSEWFAGALSGYDSSLPPGPALFNVAFSGPQDLPGASLLARLLGVGRLGESTDDSRRRSRSRYLVVGACRWALHWLARAWFLPIARRSPAGSAAGSCFPGSAGRSRAIWGAGSARPSLPLRGPVRGSRSANRVRALANRGKTAPRRAWL